MCGIAAIFRSHGSTRTEHDDLRVRRTLERLRRRGPDGAGAWRSDDGRSCLLHTRLAIQDLSDAAAQPMRSPDGAVSLSYNGEIYNAEALRSGLEREGSHFRSTSDTEVLLESIRRRGVERTLDALRGMFAFVALIEQPDGAHTAHAAVDHAGMKPLVWSFRHNGEDGPSLVLASDADALRELIDDTPALDPISVGHVLCNGLCPTPRTMWRGVHALGAGQRLEWRLGSESPPRVVRYWQPPEALAPPDSAEREARRFDDLFVSLCREHLIGDVPVGMFLSAGLDSTATALALARGGADMGRITAFTLAGERDDESDDASAVARALGMPHRRIAVGTSDLESLVHAAAEAFDAPQGYSALLTATRIARALRDDPVGRHAKVVLSGDGGDECFGGYAWHRDAPTHPLALDAFVPRNDARAEHDSLAARLADPSTPSRHRSAAALALSSLSFPHRHARRLFPGFHPAEACALVPDLIGRRAESLYTEDEYASWLAPHDRPRLPHPRRSQRIDLMGFCAQSIQPKLDRSCMSVGLELRAPFLDRRMIEWALTRDMRGDQAGTGVGKPTIRGFLQRGARDGPIPERILARPKQGFSLRLADPDAFATLRSMIDSSRLVRNGLLRRDYAAFFPDDAESRAVRWCTLAMLSAWYQTR